MYLSPGSVNERKKKKKKKRVKKDRAGVEKKKVRLVAGQLRDEADDERGGGAAAWRHCTTLRRQTGHGQEVRRRTVARLYGQYILLHALHHQQPVVKVRDRFHLLASIFFNCVYTYRSILIVGQLLGYLFFFVKCVVIAIQIKFVTV